MDKIVRLTELQAKHTEKATEVSKIERKLRFEMSELDYNWPATSLDLQDAYYELFTLKDQIAALEAELDYDALPFYKKLFTKKP